MAKVKWQKWFILEIRSTPGHRVKDKSDPQSPGAEFPAGLTLPKPVNFDAVSGNRINAFRIEIQGVGTNRRRVYALQWEYS